MFLGKESSKKRKQAYDAIPIAYKKTSKNDLPIQDHKVFYRQTLLNPIIDIQYVNDSFLITTQESITVDNVPWMKTKPNASWFSSSTGHNQFISNSSSNPLILCSGTEDGDVFVFNQKHVLRKWRVTNKIPILATGFLNPTNIFFSSSSQPTQSKNPFVKIAIRDLGSEKDVWSTHRITERYGSMLISENTRISRGHTDRVQAIQSLHPENSCQFISGGYDQRLILWDTRQQECTQEFSHGSAVESITLVANPDNVDSSSIHIASAGGEYLKIWDLRNTAQPLIQKRAHQNTITRVSYNHQQNLLITTSLDHQINFFNVNDQFNLVHHLNFDAPVFSAALSKDAQVLLVALAGKQLLKSERVDEKIGLIEKFHQEISSENYKNLINPQLMEQLLVIRDEIYLPEKRSANLSCFSKQLSRFAYKEALDSAVNMNEPIKSVALLEELRQQNRLQNALDARTDKQLVPILKFIVRWIRDARFSETLLNLSIEILRMYSPVIGESKLADEWFRILRKVVNEEIEMQDKIQKLRGALDVMILGSSVQSS